MEHPAHFYYFFIEREKRQYGRFLVYAKDWLDTDYPLLDNPRLEFTSTIKFQRLVNRLDDKEIPSILNAMGFKSFEIAGAWPTYTYYRTPAQIPLIRFEDMVVVLRKKVVAKQKKEEQPQEKKEEKASSPIQSEMLQAMQSMQKQILDLQKQMLNLQMSVIENKQKPDAKQQQFFGKR